MTEAHRSADPQAFRLTVITSDAGMAANVGGAVATYTRTFDLPQEIQDYIRGQMGTYSHVTFGLERPRG